MTIMMHARHELTPQSEGRRSCEAHQIMPRPQAGRMSIKMTALLATILVVFAVLHVVGGALLMGRVDQPPVKAETLRAAD